MDAGGPRFTGRREHEELAGRFLDAVRDGGVDGLREPLAPDVHMTGDGGGKAPQWATQFVGAENVARVLSALVPPFARIGGVVEPHQVSGQPGAIFRRRDGKVLSTWALDILDGQIQTIRTVINPDKLGHVGPVADAWAVLRETNRARQPRGTAERRDAAPSAKQHRLPPGCSRTPPATCTRSRTATGQAE